MPHDSCLANSKPNRGRHDSETSGRPILIHPFLPSTTVNMRDKAGTTLDGPVDAPMDSFSWAGNWRITIGSAKKNVMAGKDWDSCEQEEARATQIHIRCGSGHLHFTSPSTFVLVPSFPSSPSSPLQPPSFHFITPHSCAPLVPVLSFAFVSPSRFSSRHLSDLFVYRLSFSRCSCSSWFVLR